MSWLQAGCCARHESPAMGRDARGYDSKAWHAQPGRQRPRTGAELSRDDVSATRADRRLAESISQTLTSSARSGGTPAFWQAPSRADDIWAWRRGLDRVGHKSCD